MSYSVRLNDVKRQIGGRALSSHDIRELFMDNEANRYQPPALSFDTTDSGRGTVTIVSLVMRSFG